MEINIIIVLILTFLNKLVESFEIRPIDTQLLKSVFVQNTAANLNTIVTSSNIPNAETLIQITQPGYLDVQCALDCLKNLACVSYSFDASRLRCALFVRANGLVRNAPISSNLTTTQKVSTSLGCDLKTCSSNKNLVFCSASQTSGTCLGDPSKLTGVNFNTQIVYELADWGPWSPCSSTCNEGKIILFTI